MPFPPPAIGYWHFPDTQRTVPNEERSSLREDYVRGYSYMTMADWDTPDMPMRIPREPPTKPPGEESVVWKFALVMATAVAGAMAVLSLAVFFLIGRRTGRG